ncbi:hypothetical protein ASPSYDRAFT_86897 [Aspergillus sydowii CBS 593.65]|uniref:PRISE-like Rossmann-fold domain-containing protein n=1 Tax=Aspergillus sydowii CBS 593.65 TaxID=1036612 RepID=A0A1L9TLK5_9EURO|nr:uncharacterized protein ASPSYDRAFT_86897 [Aspergillus sydowii CBS 593.65]OJJ60305.1 hypothetical protein ASPSYDRAFT_86897 [Aspergillus sydowii CBS 593.65]
MADSHAIVFGAAGLLGWATLNQLLAGYPSSEPFSRVTAVLNRPVSESDLHLPAGPNRPSLEIISGIDLLQGSSDELATQLREKVINVETITHVFYFVFAPFNDNHIQECNQNCAIMQRVADALNIVAPKLQSFVYPGGSRGYGVYIPGGVFQPPLHEALADTLPEDYAKTVAYPWFRQILTAASKGRGWTWSEVCPDAVIGFTPNGSAYSLALHWAQFLSLYAYNHRNCDGKTVEVPFPGDEAGYRSLYTPVSGKILGRISIHAALNPEACGEKVINMLDNDQPISASDIWPGIAAWFGLKGVGPIAESEDLKPGEYIEKHRHLFAENGKPKALTCGVGIGNKQLDAIGWWLRFDRQFSAERLRSVGFTEQRNPLDGWLETFEAFRKAGIIF